MSGAVIVIAFMEVSADNGNAIGTFTESPHNHIGGNAPCACHQYRPNISGILTPYSPSHISSAIPSFPTDKCDDMKIILVCYFRATHYFSPNFSKGNRGFNSFLFPHVE
ncbi:MAG: hypothetical protein ACTSU2_14145 [Promethearchaeota archaeon]